MADEEGVRRVPDWAITFGDMMALLLTFFIMLVSCSEMKSEEKYQALMDSFQQQFGYHDPRATVLPGELRPRNSALSKMASSSRANRADGLQGRAKVQSPIGDRDFMAFVRPVSGSPLGTVLYFQEDQIELDENQRFALQQLGDQLRGQPQVVEIRGISGVRSSPGGSQFRDHWDISFERCRRVMQLLVAQQLDPRRLRISAAAAPLGDAKHAKLPGNSRVELILFDDGAQAVTGTGGE